MPRDGDGALMTERVAAAVALPARRDLPSGTVTFVFTDIEGSTRLAHDLGTGRWGEILAQHAAIVRRAVADHEGVIVRTEGDSFFLAFRTARQAVAAAADAERAFVAQAWSHGAVVRVRIGMHTGENARPGTVEDASDYVGYDVHRAARVSSAAHGGQVLISSVTRMLLGDQLPDGVTLRDLGEHRLKDMSQPDRLYQLVIESIPDAFPALRTLERAPNNLPVQLTSFIGRTAEIAEARRLLGATRLLTLLGPGGTGKTRLSIELAAQAMDDFPEGVWFVRLAPVSDPTLVASTVAHAIGASMPPDRSPLQAVIDHLKGRRALLVLDNFEQVAAAAPDIAAVLQGAPAVKAVVSSRAVLRVSGEQEYEVPPMRLPDPSAVPDVEELRRAEAIQLFIERARAARPDFTLSEANARAVVGIVAQLDGLPLAIELAAARVKVLPPQAILERLASGLGILQSSARDLPARQQTLRGAIAWSYDLLDPGLRRLLQRFSVFRGGAALEQIEAVCGPADEVDRDVLDGMAELVDQSLARQSASGEEPRFLTHETIRQFAHEKLEESGEAREIELRHARVYLALAEAYEPDLFGSRQKELLDRLELEQGNLRSALDICSHPQCADRPTCDCGAQVHAADDARVGASLRLAAALWRFWQMRGHLAEGRQRTERILALPGAEEHREAYLRAVEAAGGVTYWLGDLEATQAHYERRLALARGLGDEVKVANALYDLSFVYAVPNKDMRVAREMLEQALALFRTHGDVDGVAKVQWGLSVNYGQTGEWRKVDEALPEVIATFRKRDNRFGLAWALHGAGIAASRLGDLGRAREVLSEGLRLFVEAGDVSGIVLYLYDFAEVAATAGQAERALRLYGAMAALRDATGSQLANAWELEAVEWGRMVRAVQERTDPALRDRLIAAGRELTKEQAIALALAEGNVSGAGAASSG